MVRVRTVSAKQGSSSSLACLHLRAEGRQWRTKEATEELDKCVFKIIEDALTVSI